MNDRRWFVENLHRDTLGEGPYVVTESVRTPVEDPSSIYDMPKPSRSRTGGPVPVYDVVRPFSFYKYQPKFVYRNTQVDVYIQQAHVTFRTYGENSAFDTDSLSWLKTMSMPEFKNTHTDHLMLEINGFPQNNILHMQEDDHGTMVFQYVAINQIVPYGSMLDLNLRVRSRTMLINSGVNETLVTTDRARGPAMEVARRGGLEPGAVGQWMRLITHSTPVQRDVGNHFVQGDFLLIHMHDASDTVSIKLTCRYIVDRGGLSVPFPQASEHPVFSDTMFPIPK